MLPFLWEKLSEPQFCKDLTRKTAFFEGWSWFKFDNLELALGTNLEFYTNVAKGLKLKVRKFWGLIPTFVDVTGEKLVEGPFCSPPTPSWIGLISTKKNYFYSNFGKIQNIWKWICESTIWSGSVPAYNYNLQSKPWNETEYFSWKSSEGCLWILKTTFWLATKCNKGDITG